MNRGLALLLALALLMSGVGGAVALPHDLALGEITTHYMGIRCHKDTVGDPLAEPRISSGPLRPAPDLPGFTFLDYTEEISHVYSQERQWFIQGYPDGSVRPDRYLARVEAITVAGRVFHHDRDTSYYREYDRFCGEVFADVSEDDWFFGYFYTTYNTGVMLDVDGYLFEPYEYITREDALILAVRLGILTILDDVDPDDIDIPDELDPEEIDVEEDMEELAELFGLEVVDASDMFVDVDADHESLPYFTAAATFGWVKGYEDETLRPDNLMTRAEAVAVFNRVMGRTITADMMRSGKNPYNDLEPTHWAYGEMLGASINHDVIDWFGTAFHGGAINLMVERFVDQDGNDLVPPVMEPLPAADAPQAFAGYAYWGRIHAITYVFEETEDAASPMPSATKTSKPDVVPVGERATYTITLRNDAAATADWQGAVVRDELPAGFALVLGSVLVDGTPRQYELDGQTVTVQAGTLAPGETVTVTFQATALETGIGERWHNTAIIGSDNHPDIPVTDDGGIYIPAPDPGPGELVIEGTKRTSVAEVGIGEQVTYKITATAPATNGGTLYDVTMTDLLDTSKLIFVSGTVAIDGVRATPQQFSFTNRLLTVHMGDLAPGQTVTAEFRVQIRNDAVGLVIENTANIFGSSERGGGPDTSILVTHQLPVRDRDPDQPVITGQRVQLFHGDNYGNWLPERTARRSEVVQVFYRLLVRPTPPTGVTLPPDITEEFWGRDAVLYFVGRGVIGLDAYGEFGIQHEITLDEFARFLEYVRLPRPDWLVGSATMTRAQMADLLMDVQGRNRTPDTNNIPRNTFPDVPPTHWAYWIVASVSTAHSYFIDEDGNEIWDEFW